MEIRFEQQENIVIVYDVFAICFDVNVLWTMG